MLRKVSPRKQSITFSKWLFQGLRSKTAKIFIGGLRTSHTCAYTTILLSLNAYFFLRFC